MIREHVLIALRSLVLLSLLAGVAYQAGITVVSQTLFPAQANGSLIVRHGQVIGSALIGQPFDDPKYFWSRPSATRPADNAAASSGSNLGPTNPALLDVVNARIAALRKADPTNPAPIPVDLVTASASGLDPHISPAAAAYQVSRVARARGVPESIVKDVVARATQGRLFGVLGEPVVHVLNANLALDQLPRS